MRYPDTRPPRYITPPNRVPGAHDGVRGLQATIDLAPIGIAQFGLDGRFLLANVQLCQTLGYSCEELLTRTFQEITFPDDLAACEALNAQVAAGTIPRYVHEKRFVRRDGSVVWVRVTVTAVRHEKGEIAFFVGIAEDISQARASEEARLEAQARLDAALDASDTGTFRWDIRSNEVHSDAHLDRLFGLEPARTVRSLEGFQARVHPEDRPRVEQAIRRCAEEGADFDEEFRVVRPDGSVRWLWDKGRTLADSRGNPLRMTGACTDITDRKRAEEELAAQTQVVNENEARLRALVEASPLGINIMDIDGNPIFHNPKAEELHGIPFEQAGGRGWARAVHPEDRERIASSWYEAAAAGQPWADTYRFLHADGRVVWVSGRAAPMRVEGQMIGFVGTLEDITALKLAEQERKRAEVERERLLVLEREARSEAERATKRRDEVMAVVAHDLRNPLHALTASASLMIEVPLQDAERVRQLRIIRRSAKSMDNLIRDLLDIAQSESGTFAIEATRVDMRVLVPATLELFEQRAREARVTLGAEIESDLPVVSGDPDRLGQLLSNLIANAITFTPEGGRVSVRARHADGQIRVTVEDTGSGISPEQLPHIFDRFWQGRRADSKRRTGAGLGLPISKAIIEAHGGCIDVESTPGRGSAFHFALPISLQ